MPLSADPEEERGRYWFDAEEDYDTVLNKVYPLQHPSSALEQRQQYLYINKITGNRVTCHPSFILAFEEINGE